jgi:hypothetical protein
MGEVMLLSLIVGCSGLQATIAGLWLRQADYMQQHQDEEEESLTPYDSTETIENNETRRASKRDRDPRMVGWEFKVLRAHRDLFRDPTSLQQACDEEAVAGWILLEKLDDRRLRFKRPIAMREVIDPNNIGFDPYRSYYGSSPQWGRRAIGLVGLLALLIPAYLSFVLIARLQSNLPTSTPTNQAPSPGRRP